MKRLYMAQVNNRYGENVYFPYSCGLLWAYARTFPEVQQVFDFRGFLYLKEAISKAIEKLIEPDLVCFSCYVWNWEWNKALATEIKKRWPACSIIIGGPSVWDNSAKTLMDNDWVDFAVYGEGEGSFADFLLEHAKPVPDYAKVGSLIWRSDKVEVNQRRPFVELDKLRSPYLDGVFDDLIPLETRWQVLQETNRGCPFRCSFCEWGQLTLSKVRAFPLERVQAELDWFGRFGVDYLDNADANYGILKRDLELTKLLVATKEKYQHPKTFRTSFTKNSNETIWEMANILHAAGMLKAVTLAMQSMHEPTLEVIHRKNIKFDHFSSLIERYEAVGIPTYTELIMGLPGESLQTYLAGIEKNLEAGQHSGLFCYINLMLPNTEQVSLEYSAKHGLVSWKMQAMLSHGTPEPDTIRETQDVIIETATMPHKDWKYAWLFSKVFEVFHAQGLLQAIAVECHSAGLSYVSLYRDLIGWLESNPETVAGQEFADLKKLLDRVLAGGLWDCVDARLGTISWPPEEFAYARICCQLERFWSEIQAWLDFLPCSAATVEECIAGVRGPDPGQEGVWARDIVWYGRKGYGAKLRKSARLERVTIGD